MKRYASTAVMLVALLSSLALSSSAPTQYYGYYATEKTLKDRLFVPSSQFALGDYLGSGDLGALLGINSGDGLSSGFKNGVPNGTSVGLWQITMLGFSKDLGSVCSKGFPRQSELKADVLLTLFTLCEWPSEYARNEQVLDTLWLEVMGYQAPSEEAEIWKAFFMKPEYKSISGPEVISTLTYSIFLNPYFLLRN